MALVCLKCGSYRVYRMDAPSLFECVECSFIGEFNRFDSVSDEESMEDWIDDVSVDSVCPECSDTNLVCGDDAVISCAGCGWVDQDNSLGLSPDTSGNCPECGADISPDDDGLFTCQSCGYGDGH